MHIEKNSLAGKTALVTGAGSGIGEATTKILSHAGAKVALLGRTLDNVKEAFEQIGGEKCGHLCLNADISVESEMLSAFQKVKSIWPHLDILVVNAGINGVWAPLDQLKVEEWDNTINVNLRGTFLTVKTFLPLMKNNDGGSIIVVSSINGTRVFSNSGATAYSCTKAAQVAFTKMTALEFAKDKIRVNVVCPGAIETKIDESTEKRNIDQVKAPADFPKGEVPLNEGNPGTSGEVAQLIWFLASDAASHITGTEVYIDGGQSLLRG